MATQVVVHRQILPSLIPSPEFSFPQGRRPNSLPPTLSFQEPTRRESESSRLKREEFQERVMALLPLVKRVAMQMRERLPLHVEEWYSQHVLSEVSGAVANIEVVPLYYNNRCSC